MLEPDLPRLPFEFPMVADISPPTIGELNAGAEPEPRPVIWEPKQVRPRHRGKPTSQTKDTSNHKPRHCSCCADSGMHLFREDRRG